MSAVRSLRILPPPALTERAPLEPLLGAIYESPLEAYPWRSALQLLQEQLQAAHVSLMLCPPSRAHAGTMINTGAVDEGALRSYGTHFYALDPFVHLRDGEVVTAEEWVGRKWLRSPIYLEYNRALDVRHILGADLYPQEGIECRLRVTRSHDARPFTAADKALCRRLLPHLKCALRLHARIDALEGDRQLLAGTLNRLQLGLISLAADGRVLELNGEARRILDEQDGLRLCRNALGLDSGPDSRALQKLLLQARSEGAQQPAAATLSVTRPSGRRLICTVCRTAARHFGPRGMPASVIVFLRDPESWRARPSLRIMRRLFGLSRMQARLALLLSEGLTVEQAAQRLGICRNTARCHLTGIFDKTGARSQSALIRRLLTNVLNLCE